MEGLGQKAGFGAKPKALVCHICGREFGTKSLTIHVKACAKKWEEQESLKPPNQRRPVPQAPELPPEMPVGATRADLDRRNEAALATFEQQAMVQCPNCGRTFLEDRLSVHQRSCTAEHPAKAVLGKASPGEKASPPAAAHGGRKSGASEEIKASPTASPPQLQQAVRPAKEEKKLSSPEQVSPVTSPSKPVAKPSPPISRPEQQQGAGTAKFCPECGAKYAEAAKFCADCGKKRP